MNLSTEIVKNSPKIEGIETDFTTGNLMPGVKNSPKIEGIETPHDSNASFNEVKNSPKIEGIETQWNPTSLPI